MATETTQGQQTKQAGDSEARSLTTLNLLFAGKMTDEFLPKDQFLIFKTKPFAEWPEELQEKLAPFGASLIR
jgi:hypothetical protein